VCGIGGNYPLRSRSLSSHLAASLGTFQVSATSLEVLYSHVGTCQQGWAHRTLAPILSSDDASAAISASHLSSQDGQSLARWTLPGSLAVSTELANRAVSSICLAGLCDWSLACVSFGFDPLSSSSTVGFRGILVSPWPFTVPTSIQRIGCSTCARFWDKDYDNGKLLDGRESMRRFISAICFSNSQRSRIGYQAHCGLISACVS
jgi:hypothetical protein